MKPTEAIFMGIALLAVGLLMVAYIYCLRYVFQYEVGPEAVRVKLFGLVPLRRIKLKEIEEVVIISPKDALPFSERFRLGFIFAEHWPSCVPRKEAVFIQKRTGISRRLVLTPQNAREFTDKILQYRHNLSEMEKRKESGPPREQE